MNNLTESGHFYTRQGEPAYTVPYAGKREGERPTHVGDARKLGLVPSVTTVEKIISAPGLENWKAKQVLLAAATLPRDPAWTDDEWIAAVMADASEQAKAAAERGSAIHGAIELALREGSVAGSVYNPYYKHVEAAFAGLMSLVSLDYLSPHEVEPTLLWQPEMSFSHPLGYGGKVDACLFDGNGYGYVVDFKTKEFSEDDIAAGKVRGWDNHARQLAAYGYGLGLTRFDAANIFISTSNPGLWHVHIWKPEEIEQGWQQFQAALSLWKTIKGFDPSFNNEEA